MIETISDGKYIDMVIRCGHMTNDECNSFVCTEAKQKYCPAVKGNCLAEKCAFFVVSRPCTDKRYLKAKCTYAGTRDVAMLYGYPKEEEDD